MTDRELPRGPLGDEAGHLVAFLRYYRATVVEKCRSLPPAELTTTRVPTGWTPLALAFHLACMERRWVGWGFRGTRLDEPHPDAGEVADGPWAVPAGWGLDDVVDLLDATARTTEAVLATTPLDTEGSEAGRFGAEAEHLDGLGRPPTLRWIGFHVRQEYARHTGQLDVAVELAAGLRGE